MQLHCAPSSVICNNKKRCSIRIVIIKMKFHIEKPVTLSGIKKQFVKS